MANDKLVNRYLDAQELIKYANEVRADLKKEKVSPEDIEKKINKIFPGISRAENIVRLADSVKEDAKVEFPKSYTVEELATMSLDDLVSLDILFGLNSADTEMKYRISEAIKTLVKTARENDNLPAKDMQAAELLSLTGYLNKKDTEFVEAAVAEYDEQHGLNKKVPEIEERLTAIDEMSENLTKEENAELDSCFEDVVYTDKTEVDPKEAEAYNQKIREEALMRTYCDLLGDDEFFKVSDEKERKKNFVSRWKENISDEILLLQGTTAGILTEKDLSEKDHKELVEQVKQRTDGLDKAKKKKISVDALIIGYNIRLHDVKSLAQRLHQKARGSKIFKNFDAKVQGWRKTARALWGKRQVIAENMVNNIKNNRFQVIGNYAAAGALIAGSLAGGWWVMGASAAYGAWSWASNKWGPILKRKNELKAKFEKAHKAKGTPIPSRKELMEMAKKDVLKDKHYVRQLENSTKWGIAGALVTAGTGMLFGPLAPAAAPLLAKVPVLGASLTTHATTYIEDSARAAERPYDQNAQIEAKKSKMRLGMTAAFGGLVLFSSAGRVLEGAAENAPDWAQGIDLDNVLHGNDASAAQEVAEGVTANPVEGAGVVDQVTANPVDTADVPAATAEVDGADVNGTEVAADGNAAEAAAEVASPFTNPWPDERLVRSMKSWMNDDQIEDLITAASDSRIAEMNPALAGVNPTQLAYLMARAMHNTRDMNIQDLMDMLRCGNNEQLEVVAGFAADAKDTYAIDQSLGFELGHNMKYDETKCVITRFVKAKNGCGIFDTKVVTTIDCGCDVEDVPEDIIEELEVPEETPVIEDTPEETPVIEDTPEETPVIEDTPQETPVIEDTPEETPVIEDTPEETVEQTTPSGNRLVGIITTDGGAGQNNHADVGGLVDDMAHGKTEGDDMKTIINLDGQNAAGGDGAGDVTGGDGNTVTPETTEDDFSDFIVKAYYNKNHGGHGGIA